MTITKKFIITLLITFILLTGIVAAEPQYPHLTPYVNDFAGLLSPTEINDLNVRCAAIREKTSVEIAIVTVKNTMGVDVITYANRVGEANGVGNGQTDNGIVLLYSDSDMAGFAIAPGRGEETIITDYRAHQYAVDALPYLESYQYYKAFDVALSGIQTAVQAEQAIPITPKSSIGFEIVTLPIILGAILYCKKRSK
jgi:uncharacterized protein